MGHGSGNPYNGIPNGGGNGLVLHLGPTPPSQMTGSSTSWGNGLDVSFSSYDQGGCPHGVNVEYNPVSGSFTPGSATSVVATWTVQVPAAIIGQPSSPTLPAGASAALTVTVTNAASTPLSYQWWRVLPGTSTSVVATVSSSLP